MSLPFVQQCIQTVQQFPIIQQTQELRQIYLVNSQLQKPLGKFRVDNSFWNQDISKIEIETAKLLHQFAYSFKPEIVHQFNFEEYLQKKARLNLTMEDYRQKLLEFYEMQMADLYLRKRYLLRNRITSLHQPTEEVLFYDPLQQSKESVPIQMFSTGEIKQPDTTQEELQLIEEKLKEFNEISEKLSNERIFDNQKYDQEIPQIQMSADDDLIFERVNQKVYASMPFITSKHLKEFYEVNHGEFIKRLEDLDNEILAESLPHTPNDVADFGAEYLIPVTMPTLQEALQELATEQGIQEDMMIDNGALFLFAIDKFFVSKIQEQSSKYLLFLPYNLDQNEQKSKTFQQQTMNILNELKEEKIRKSQYRIRSTAHWIDSVQIIPQQVSDLDHIVGQYEDSSINSWMKFLLQFESEKIVDKLNKDIALLQEKVHSAAFPEIYFQFYLRYQKLLYLDCRQSLVEMLHCLNVIRTTQKNLNQYFMDVHSLKNQVTTERISKRQQMNLSAFLTNLEVPTEVQSNPTSAYLCEERISKNEEGIYEVIDGNGYRILNEVIFKDFLQLQQQIAHMSAFTLQFTMKIGEKHPQSDSQQLNRLKAVRDYLRTAVQLLKQKCEILKIVMPLLPNAKTIELSNAICILAHFIQSQPKFIYSKHLLNSYRVELDRLQLLTEILQHTNSLRLISKLIPIESLSVLSRIHKYIKRDRLVDKPFPLKYLYKDPILDKRDNLNLVMRKLPEDGNFSIFSLMEFQSLRRKLYKTSLRIFYQSEIYQQQILQFKQLNRVLQRLEQIPNRIVDDSNFNFFELYLDEYLKIGKECNAIESWQQIASDNYRMIDLLMPLKSLLLLDYLLFNAIHINNLQSHQFVDVLLLKEKVALQAITNVRKQNIMPQHQAEPEKGKINAVSMLSSNFRGSMMVKNFISKLTTSQATILQEFNLLILPYCTTTTWTYQALVQRNEMINLNANFPFVKDIFTDEPFLDDLRVIQNPFILHSIPAIMDIINFKDLDQRLPQKVENNEEDWYTTTKLKIEKNHSPLSPNKKALQFKSSGSPFSTHVKLIEPISSSQQLALQLVYQLFAVAQCNCNSTDLVYFRQGLLRLDELKRNQLRLRRDLEGFQQALAKAKANVLRIAQSKTLQNVNSTIMTYMAKVTKRLFYQTLTTLMASIHQFRNEEGYEDIIKTIRHTLCAIQFRNASHVERLIGEAPRTYPSLQAKSLYSTKSFLLRYVFADKYFPVHYTNPNNLRRPLFTLTFEDQFTQISPFIVPTHKILFRTQKLNYNFESFFSSVIKAFPNAITQLFSLFPQSKLIYYSTIQDLIISETESILREKCIFEIDDLYKYERAYRKVTLLHLRYLVLSEFFTVQKCKILPFQNTKTDPCSQWLEEAQNLSDQLQRKQQFKASFLANIPSVAASINKQFSDLKRVHSNRSQLNRDKSERFSILPRLRLDTFENQVFQLVAMMIGCQAIIYEEGIQYLAQLNNQLSAKEQPFELVRNSNVFYNNLERDSLKITTLNKGMAHVIADTDLERHLSELNDRLIDYARKLEPKDLMRENNELKKMYNQKSLELKFAAKKLKFYEENINHIVESLVAQRTNDLIFENDGLKQQLDTQQKAFDIQKQHLRDEIRCEFQEELKTQDLVIKELHSRFNDYKRGISLELGSFIQEYRNDGLKRVRDKASEALFGTANKVNIDLDGEFQRVGVYDQFKEESRAIAELFRTIKSLRTFYLWKEMCLKEKYERQIQVIVNANSSNEELQQRIQELTEKVEILKDELISNRKIITIMDNQNQILRRDLHKFKVERFQQMREKGQLGAIATYKEQEDQLNQQLTENASRVRPTTAGLLKKPKQLLQTQSVPKLPNKQKNVLQMKYKVVSGSKQ